MNKAEMSLGDRMKYYEKTNSPQLISRCPVILRCDGRSWHTFCRQFNKPYDLDLINLLNEAAIALCEEIQGAKLAFIQSDEISILITDYDTLYQSPWFGYKGYKMTSISAAQVSVRFYRRFIYHLIKQVGTNLEGALEILADDSKETMFDSRVYNLPEDEVCNYFIWRQQDWTRNSIQMLSRSLYSQKQLQNKNTKQLQEMCFQKGHNWNDLPTFIKRGRCIVYKDSKWQVDNEIPIFTQDRAYIENLLKAEDK